MLVVVQAVRVHEVGILTAELGGFLVHHIDEYLRIAAAHIIGEHERRIVAGGDHHAVEQLHCRKYFALPDAGEGASRSKQLGDDFLADGNLRIFQIGDVLHRNDIGHDFCCGCGVHPLIGVLLVDDRVGVEVNQFNRL